MYFHILYIHGLFHENYLIFTPAWMSSSIYYEVWDEITYPFPNINGAGFGMETQLYPTLYWESDNSSMLWKLVNACLLNGP